MFGMANLSTCHHTSERYVCLLAAMAFGGIGLERMI